MGILLPVIEANAKYRKSPEYDELITVEASISELPVARIRISYKVFREGDSEPLVEGYTVHGFINAETGKPTRAPNALLNVLEGAFKEG